MKEAYFDAEDKNHIVMASTTVSHPSGTAIFFELAYVVKGHCADVGKDRIGGGRDFAFGRIPYTRDVFDDSSGEHTGKAEF
ncbi:hypothetical protein [Enterocloster sp.]|uniref:hypothetical protein n=1 Tax=Enterocloster sp. TaxID=2719315 RepID=UPI0039A243E5